ncbi:cytochrome c oxidase assembly protein [Halomonas sp. PAMB 3264]|uniref:cytochrome c oxidase assembly protein n=1 Tax=Halomonas sp. PAMB 3264 TaxID=3075222 RepID=UPI0028994389|nr:cytochrome c oxidase assembly protein [Halomonas sp. PAMB 3264]WNL42597.1 cytochrome c oxidase assembly protein [Halomonas sp. PAMB 3264]
MHAGHPASPLDWLPFLLVVLVTCQYLAAAGLQRAGGSGWSLWRCGFFLLGSALLAIAFWPSLMAWAHGDLVGHMTLHLLIGMFAPLFWVLAAPMTLLLKTLPQAGGKWMVRFLHSRFMRLVTHPVTATLLNVGGMYVLYLTPLYAASLENSLLHYMIHLHFLLAGYLFCWAILAEPDASPHRLSLRFRLIVLFAAIATHSLLGKLMYGWGFPRDTGHTLEHVQAAAQWMYYGGDLAEVLLAVVLMTFWLRRPAGRREALLGSHPQTD